jgi:hypothetical protein
MAQVDYGIEHIKMVAANTDGSFPDFNVATGVKLINLIVTDSFSEDKEDDQETEILWEDQDGIGLVLPGQKGKKTITFQSNDLSAEQYEYFMGYKKTSAGGWVEETPGFVLPAQAMEVKTREIDDYPATTHQWAKVKVNVKRTGNTGKNGLPNLTFNVTMLANTTGTGIQVAGHRFKNA